MSEEFSKRVVELDKRYVWHPYTEMSHYRQYVEPLVIVAASGSRLIGADGRRYLDANGSWWTSVLGHNHPRLVAALRRQSELLCHAALGGIAHAPAAELAEALCTAAPGGLRHVFFSDNGSTSVEVAMKLSLQYWAQNGRPGRTRFLALEEGYHGDTLGTNAIGGVEVFRKPFAGVLPDCIFVPPARDDSQLDRSLSALTSAIERNADSIAAVVFESIVQGAAGMRIYAPEMLRVARELCDRHDVFLICDEVFTGYGRTGPMWACEHAGIAPDLLCVSKSFTGGVLPMAATLATDRVFDGFLGAADRAFYYGHTYCGNPLGAAVALEVLNVFEQERILERAKPKAERIARAFQAMAALPGVAATRSLGMIGALDLAGEGGYLARLGWRVYSEAQRRGAYLRPIGNVVYVVPALNISDDDLGELLAVVRESVAAAAAR
ncbi:MAG TPA: adenosylmethionine--8-amino-7-oxononanoate transaminase [Gammaproteobacteria bacterium]|nr:adenosylmethionine--8-amino-7-oxononanoate transaminase [Gammaproteobacteria bacterium]